MTVSLQIVRYPELAERVAYVMDSRFDRLTVTYYASGDSHLILFGVQVLFDFCYQH